MHRQITPSGNFLVTSFTSSTGPNSDNNNNMPSAAAATAAAYDPMSQVLATFSCPRDCHLFEASYREMINCPFGHSPNSTGQQLKKVPPAACICSLLGECEKTVKKRVVDLLSGATISNSQSSSSLSKLAHATDSLTIAQCSEGVHFSVEQLVDLEHFYEQNTAANLARIQAAEEGETTGGEVTIAATTSSNGNNNNSQQQQAPPQLPSSSSASVSSFSSQPSRASVAIRERECAICLLSMAEGQPLGMLSQCVHVFCASCLINWFRSPPPPSLANLNRLQTCPVCRATSSFVLPWPRPLTGRAEKWTIFKLQHDALHMVSEQLAPHEGDEEEDGENGDGDEEDGENEDMEEEDNSGDTSNDEEHIDREGEGDSSSSSEEDI